MLLTIERPLLDLGLAACASNTICGKVWVWSVDVGSEVYEEPVGVGGATCVALAVAVLTHVEICIIAAFWAICIHFVSGNRHVVDGVTHNSIGLE